MTLTGDKHDEQQLNRNHFIRETSQKNKQQNRIRLHPREGLTLNIHRYGKLLFWSWHASMLMIWFYVARIRILRYNLNYFIPFLLLM